MKVPISTTWKTFYLFRNGIGNLFRFFEVSFSVFQRNTVKCDTSLMTLFTNGTTNVMRGQLIDDMSSTQGGGDWFQNVFVYSNYVDKGFYVRRLRLGLFLGFLWNGKSHAKVK